MNHEGPAAKDRQLKLEAESIVSRGRTGSTYKKLFVHTPQKPIGIQA